MIALGLMALFFAMWVGPNWGLFRRSSLFWLTVAFSLFVVGRALTGYWGAPASGGLQVKWAIDLLWIGGIAAVFLVPWQLGPAGEKRLDWAFALVVLSLFIQAMLQMEWGHLREFLMDRPWFQMNPNAFGTLAGILLLGTLVLGLRWISFLPSVRPRWGRFAGWGLWSLALLGLVGGLLVSQSRASWLAAVVTVPVALGVVALAHIRKGGRWKRTALGGLVAFSLIAGGAVYSQWGMVEHRALTQHKTVEEALSLDLSNLPAHSVGRRLRLYAFGLRHIPERPLFGWSPGQVEGLIAREGGPAIKILTYMHNMPLQIAMQLGLVGFALFFGMVAVSAREVFRATRAGRLPFEWGVFWLGALGYLAVEG
ncbi:MAG TPA: O-antigen ligase family protein, partial [Gammaproteobacteria bacterium]|nr:O-antigen ligase family protein [Gammaproteobacteria bacterium]